MKKVLVSVIGGHKCSEETFALAQKLGRIIAQANAVLVCGGRSGVMSAACKGAQEAGGLTIGIMPSDDGADANENVDIAVLTGLGFARNTIVATTSDIVIALAGEYGTLSEIAFALSKKKKVYSLGFWDIDGVINVSDVDAFKDIISKLTNIKGA